MAYVTYLKSPFRSNMNIEIKRLIPWGIFTNSITLLPLSCWEFLVNQSPVSGKLWIPTMHDGIIKLQKQKKNIWSSRVKTSKRGSLEREPKSSEGTQRYQGIGDRYAIIEKYPMNLKCQSSHGTENPSKGSTSRI